MAWKVGVKMKIYINSNYEIKAINQSEDELESLVSLVKSLGAYYMEIGLLVEEGNADKNKLTTTYNGNNLSAILNRLNEKYTDSNSYSK